MYKMLYCERIDVSESIDINKTSVSKECIVSHYSYFLYKGLRLQPVVCNGRHDVLIINGISKSETINSLQNADLSKKSGSLKNITFLSHLKNE